MPKWLSKYRNGVILFTGTVLIIIVVVASVWLYRVNSSGNSDKTYCSFSIEIQQNDSIPFKILVPLAIDNTGKIHRVVNSLVIESGSANATTINTEKGYALQIIGNGTLKLSGRIGVPNSENPPSLSMMNRTIDEKSRTYLFCNENSSGSPLRVNIRLNTHYYYDIGDVAYNYETGGYLAPNIEWQELYGNYQVAYS